MRPADPAPRHICRRCENLDNGTCMACGCYVEMRAARLDMHCPLTRAVW